ncbi:MAG: hypothetical protein IJI67_08615 [Clostridia bacterium]|nr:hypothetical protein [Clostridia bacterium]
MKKFRKALSLCLVCVMLVSGMVFAVPQASAASFPTDLHNGAQAVTYTQSDAAQGKYLVQIEVVKYSPNYSQQPKAIKSESGDITIVHRPDNGTAPEVTERLFDVIDANAFNYEGEGSFVYNAVITGFPQKATVSVKKTNMADNDSGIYAGLKIWNAEIGSFEAIYDFSKIERSNGEGTSDLMFSNVSALSQYYPYAKQGDATVNNLTLPAGLSATSAVQTFSVVDQWGVTMMAPNFAYTPVTGLTFSQDKNVMTIKGTGDANNPDANTRSVNLKATYATLNTSVPNNYSLTKTITVTNSSTMTYAPTFANREKAGLTIYFKADGKIVDQYLLNSSFQMTTTNTMVVTNNSSRTATVSFSSSSADKLKVNPASDTLTAGQTKTYQLLDLKAASANYNADITVSYTLDGLYDAATGNLANLSTGATIPFVNHLAEGTTADVRLYDNNGGSTWGWLTGTTVDVYCKYQSDYGVIDLVSTSGQNNNNNQQSLKANFYIDTDLHPTYQSAGLGFYFKPNDSSTYYFQPDEDDSGYYVQRGTYDAAGTFGFSTSAAASAHTSRYCEKVNINLPTGGKFVPFYGTIFTGSSTQDAPAEIYFDGDQDNDDGLNILTTTSTDNSCYLNSSLYVYAYSRKNLRTSVDATKGMLSCYYNANKWSAMCSMSSSTIRTAQIELGNDITSQYKINQKASALNSALTEFKKQSANGTYCLIHNKHTGDKASSIAETTVDFYLFETGASNVLRFNGSYADSCNKHSDSFMPTLTTKGTYEHTYDYWNIDFSDLNDSIANFNTVSANGQFTNVDEACGSELLAARSVDTTSATSNPGTQNEVDTIVNNLNNAMRNLQYTSFDMYVYHRMLNPTGTHEIENEIIQPYTETYNKTTTYGEVLDGTADLGDGTYTVKGYHYEPQPDSTFAQYASRYYYQGISSEYICEESKDITMVYYAKQMTDTTLSEMIADVEEHVDDWDGVYTEISIEAFVDWFDENYNELTQVFSIFDVDEYNALLEEFQTEYNKLDPIATTEQLEQVDQFIFNYETLQDFGDSFCNSAVLLERYADAYASATELNELALSNNAGEHAAAAVLNSAEGFALTQHTEGAHNLLTPPKDGIDGTYYVMCSNCGSIVDSGSFASPKFNRYQVAGYDYANRAAALRITEESTQSDYQDMRFTGACEVPEDAEVIDFGFVYTQTKYLNGGVEPTDNTPVNVDQLVEGGMYVTKFSMINGHYSIYTTESGTDIYTYNLVLKLKRANWDTHYAARSYVTYSIDGMEVTVYDSSYSSRTVLYIAQQAVNNPQESPNTRAYLAEKFGL